MNGSTILIVEPFALPLFKDEAIEILEELGGFLEILGPKSERMLGEDKVDFPILGLEEEPTKPDAGHVAEIGAYINIHERIVPYMFRWSGHTPNHFDRFGSFLVSAPSSWPGTWDSETQRFDIPRHLGRDTLCC